MMKDDGNFMVADYAAYKDNDGTWRINTSKRLSGVGISYSDEHDLTEWSFKMARRIYEEHGRIKKGAPFYRVIGKIHAASDGESV